MINQLAVFSQRCVDGETMMKETANNEAKCLINNEMEMRGPLVQIRRMSMYISYASLIL